VDLPSSGEPLCHLAPAAARSELASLAACPAPSRRAAASGAGTVRTWYYRVMARTKVPAEGDDVRNDSYDGLTMAFSSRGDSPVLRARLESRQGGHSIALVIASGQMALPWARGTSVTDGSGLKKAAIGAASVVALRWPGAISWQVAGRDRGSGRPGLGSRVPGQAPEGSHWPDPAVTGLW